MSDITEDDLQRLTQWDTPTICNAIEEIMPERRGHGYTTEPLVALDPDLSPICGYARTALIRAAEPSAASGDVAAKMRLDYYEYVSQNPGPTIVVIQDIDPVPGYGAFWGEVQTHVHKGLGAVGGVTNGSFRDVTDSVRDFNLLGGEVGPSHAWVHLVDFDCQATVYGLTVVTDDIVHADRHGAVMIPKDVVKQIPAMVELIAKREVKILDAAKSPDFNFEMLKSAIGAAKEIH